MFLYETHLHTSEASACARSTGAEMAQACFNAGYTGIIVTDHFFYGNTCINRDLPWQDWVTEFCRGYENAKKRGDELGLQVFFGWESCYHHIEFLVYGLDKEWLLSHPEIKDATLEEQFTIVTAMDGLVVHAHPFREEPYIPKIELYPTLVHGVETHNASHASPLSTSHNILDFDLRAQEYAKQHRLVQTGGSDVHKTIILGGGTEFYSPLADIHDFTRRIKTSDVKALHNGLQTDVPFLAAEKAE